MASRSLPRASTWSHLCSATLLATLAACGGGGGGTPAVTPPPVTPPVVAQTISLSMPFSRIVGSKPVTLTAALGQSADVTWALGAGSPGTLSATSGASVTYTPPAAAVAVNTPVTITATSAGVTATARLALAPDPRQRTGLALLAGSLGGNGLIDGAATAARYNVIAAMDTDSDGNLVVADLINNPNGTTMTAIRRIGPDGAALTLTPQAFLSYGHADGDTTHAQTGAVTGLAVAPNKDIYLVDNDGTARLRVLRNSGQLVTLQSATPGNRVLVDRSGTVYVYNSARITRVAADGSSTVLAGGADNAAQADGQGSAARFWNITDATVDATGNLYVSDANTLRKITPSGLVSTVAGLASASGASVDGSGTAARFSELLSVSLDASGNVQALDQMLDASGNVSYALRQVTPAGVASTVYQGSAPPFTGIFAAKDTATRVVQLRFNATLGRTQLAHTAQVDQLVAGKVQPFSGFEGDSDSEIDGPGASARFVRLSRLAADLSGNVYTLDFAKPYGGARNEDTNGLWLRKITPDGTVSTLVADPSFALKPNAMAADADGNIYLSAGAPQISLGNRNGGGLFKVTPDGKVSLFAGAAAPVAVGSSTDGTGSAATFLAPQLEGIDVSGNLYLTDGATIRKVTPQAVVTTVAALPAGLKAAPDGNVYSADPVQNVIYATDASGNKSAVVGVAGVLGTKLTSLPAGLEHPTDIVPTGPHSFAVISGSAVLRLLLPN
ncbi:hypothetical protein LPN04_01625 [Rugamonas sp. A1-17]|nr:hypothetical protein [Rugamonas sp. A1-17]